MTRRAQVRGIGGYVPDKVLSNADLAEIMDTSDEWIVSRSGIHQRHQADDSVMASDLGVIAAQNALAHAGMSIADIDLIVVATSTPDFAFPATASIVQHKLGSSHGAAFDVQAACSGFVYGMSLVTAMIETGQANGALLIGAELMTRLLDWQDRSTAVLFGDGAGAIVLSGEEVGSEAPHVIKNYIRSDGQFTDLLYATGSANAAAKDAKIHYFSVNPNGRRESVTIKLRPRPKLKKLRIDIDFADLMIKGRTAKGNLVTKNYISKVEQRDVGGSTLSARKIWWDEVVSRLNNEG